jgi:hypothetical protein
MKDLHLAGIILVLFFVVVAAKIRSPDALNLLSALSRPGATVLLLGLVVLVYSKGLPLTAMMCGVLVVFLLQQIWVRWPASDEKRLSLEVGRDLARFDPSTSIDLQFANGLKHNTPHLLTPPNGWNEMLIFPPSSETLNEMCGSPNN